jgi:hypothetical protein
MQKTLPADAIRALPAASAEHAFDFVEQAAAQGGEIGRLSGQQGIHHPLVFGGQLRFDEISDRLDRGVNLFRAEAQRGEAFFEFVHEVRRVATGTETFPT